MEFLIAATAWPASQYLMALEKINYPSIELAFA